MSATKSYTRIVATTDGGAAFEDAELHLDEMQVSEGVPPMFVGGLGARDGAMFTTFAAFDSERHPVQQPTWVIMLRGTGHVAVTVGEEPFEALLIPAEL